MLALAVLLAVAASQPATPSNDPVVARIGSATLTRSFLTSSWKALPRERQKGYERQGGVEAFVRDLVQQRTLAVAAEKRGYLDRPETAAALENTRNAVLAQALLEDEVTGKLVNEQALRDFFDRHHDGFTIPESATIRMVAATPYVDRGLGNTNKDDAKSEAEARAKIERLRTELVGGTDFASLAKQWSEDVSADKGGLLAPIRRGQMVKEIDDVAFALKIGEISPVLKTIHGFHLLRVESRTAVRQQTFDEVRDRVEAAVMSERQKEVRPRIDEFLKGLDAELQVSTDPQALAALAATLVPSTGGSSSATRPAPASGSAPHHD